MLWYVIGYFLIGLIGSCVVQYYKGRTGRKNESNPIRDLELDLLAASVFAIWPGVMVVALAVAVVIVIAFPMIKLYEFCTKLGRRHRGQD